MDKKYWTRTIKILAIIGVSLWPLRFLTLILLWLHYGESANGSIAADNAYQLFPIRHFPIGLPLASLAYQTIKNRFWTTNRNMLKSNLFAGIGGLSVYILFELLGVFEGS